MPPDSPSSPDPGADPKAFEMLRTLAREAAGYGRDLARLFAAEMRDNARSMRNMAILGGLAMLLLLTGFLILSAALVGAVAYGLASWRWALLIVGAAYGLLGALLLATGARALRRSRLRLEQTRSRLRQDAAWVKAKLAA